MEHSPQAQVTKLAGPGVAGLESDPPVYHFDLDSARMPALLADPIAFVRGLGLRREHGIAPTDEMTVTLSDWAWDGSRWIPRQDREPDDAGSTSMSCCYISGPAEMTCFTHMDPEQ